MARLTLELARLPLALRIEPEGLSDEARARYGPFLASSRAACTVDVGVRPLGRRARTPRVAGSRGGLSCRAERFRWSLDAAGRRGRAGLAAARAQDLDGVLRTLFASLLPRRGTLMIHAASIGRGGSAQLFIGPSGSGKTTLSRRLAGVEGVVALTDELSAVEGRAGGFRAHSSPFWGEFRPPFNNGSLPLARLVFLRKGGRSLVPVDPAEAQRRLWRCVVSFESSRPALERCWELMLSLVSACPAFELGWGLGEAPADLAARIWE